MTGQEFTVTSVFEANEQQVSLVQTFYEYQSGDPEFDSLSKLCKSLEFIPHRMIQGAVSEEEFSPIKTIFSALSDTGMYQYAQLDLQSASAYSSFLLIIKTQFFLAFGQSVVENRYSIIEALAHPNPDRKIVHVFGSNSYDSNTKKLKFYVRSTATYEPSDRCYRVQDFSKKPINSPTRALLKLWHSDWEFDKWNKTTSYHLLEGFTPDDYFEEYSNSTEKDDVKEERINGQELELSVTDVRWVYAPEYHELQGCSLEDMIGKAIIQWIHTGEIWLITDGRKPIMACHAISIMTATELVGIRMKAILNKTTKELEQRMREGGFLITRFEILCFDAETSDVSFIFAFNDQKEARKSALRSFDIVFIAMKEVELMSFVDIGDKADQLFTKIEGANQEEIKKILMNVVEISSDWCTSFDVDNYVDRFRERTKKSIVIPTKWDDL